MKAARQLTTLGMAAIWTVPPVETTFDFHAGADERLIALPEALANESGLAAAPKRNLGPLCRRSAACF
jgi:hypothetical protein